MNNRVEQPEGIEGYRHARRQLRRCHRALATIELERQVALVSPSDYRSCRRSVLLAIDELEALVRTERGTGGPDTSNIEKT